MHLVGHLRRHLDARHRPYHEEKAAIRDQALVDSGIGVDPLGYREVHEHGRHEASEHSNHHVGPLDDVLVVRVRLWV